MRPTEPFRREHEELLAHIDHLARAAREVPRLETAEREELVIRILSFLRGTLVPHAEAEEEVLYPEWAKLVGFDAAAVPMVHDHQAIVARIERLEQAGVDDIDTLQELLYGLYALISVHFRRRRTSSSPRSTRRRLVSSRQSSSAWKRSEVTLTITGTESFSSHCPRRRDPYQMLTRA